MPDGFQLRIPNLHEIKEYRDWFKDNIYHNATYQFKDLDCEGDVYVLQKNNTLLRYSDSQAPTFSDYTGEINICAMPADQKKFATSMPKGDGKNPVTWVEYFLNFENGVLVSWRPHYSEVDIPVPLLLAA